MITLRQLEIFKAAARHGGFRRCAEQLGLSQVAVSEHIRMLEDRLGCTLFDRRPGGPASLTNVGEKALRRVTAILAEIDDFIDEIGGGDKAVSVAMNGFLMRNLYDVFNTFTRGRPDLKVKLDLHDQSAEMLLERLRQRTLDLAYFYTLEEADAPGAAVLRHEPLAIFVGSGHPLAQRGTVTATELRRMPIIQLSEGYSLRILVDRALAAIGADGSPVQIESHDFGVLLATLQQNQGFICMFEASETEVTTLYNFTRLEIDPPLPPLQVRVAARRSGAHAPALLELRELIGTAETDHWPRPPSAGR